MVGRFFSQSNHEGPNVKLYRRRLKLKFKSKQSKSLATRGNVENLLYCLTSLSKVVVVVEDLPEISRKVTFL